MGGSSGAEDAKYIYIKVVGEELVAVVVLTPKCGSLGMLTKKVGDDIKKLYDWKSKINVLHLSIIQRIVLQK